MRAFGLAVSRAAGRAAASGALVRSRAAPAPPTAPHFRDGGGAARANPPWLPAHASPCSPFRPLPTPSPQTHSASRLGQRRFLNVHEYISMDLMKEYGIPVPKGRIASTAAEAEAIAAEMLQGVGGA